MARLPDRPLMHVPSSAQADWCWSVEDDTLTVVTTAGDIEVEVRRPLPVEVLTHAVLDDHMRWLVAYEDVRVMTDVMGRAVALSGTG